MAERHVWENDDFEVRADVSNDGDLQISFHESGKCVFSTDWDTFREVIDFVAKHGLGMENPYIVEYADTREAIEA